jgi:hypothetical protein
MSNNIVEFIINVTGNARGNIEKIGSTADGAVPKVNGFMTAVQKIRDVGFAVQMVTGLFNKLSSSVSQLTDAYNMQATAETKLAAVMRNTMGVGREEVQSILDLASAQQKLGVIGDEVQLAGAQEMATYLGEKASLEKLLPALNDMLAQQYGLNASQEQAATIGMMLGKVMQGQTGALSRYGYAFDEAQEKILKTGTEAERAAVLFDVVSEAVGGVNAALAATPEGKLQQLANNSGDLQERVGRLATLAQSAFLPVQEAVQRLIGGIIEFFEANMSTIRTVVGGIATGITTAFNAVFVVISKLVAAVEFCLPAVAGLAAGFVALKISVVASSASMAWFTVRFYTYTVATKVAAVATKGFSAALKAIQAHPVIAAITALAAITVFAVSAFKKFSAQQHAAEKLVNSTASKILVEKDGMNQLFDALRRTEPHSERRKQLLQEMNEKYPGLLGNQNLEAANERELEQARRAANDELERSIFLQASKEQRESSAKKVIEAQESLANKLFAAGYSEMGIRIQMDAVRRATEEAFATLGAVGPQAIMDKVFGVKGWNSAGMSEYANVMGHTGDWKAFIRSIEEGQKKGSAMERFGAVLGINSSLSSAVSGTTAGAAPDLTSAAADSASASASAIATGGTRSTTVNIKIEKGIGDVYFQGTTRENQSEIERNLAESLYRILGMAETAI